MPSKKCIAKIERIAKEKAALRQRITDMLTGANEGPLEEMFMNDVACAIGTVCFGRWIESMFREFGDESNMPAFKPWYLQEFVTIESATDHLYFWGVRA